MMNLKKKIKFINRMWFHTFFINNGITTSKNLKYKIKKNLLENQKNLFL